MKNAASKTTVDAPLPRDLLGEPTLTVSGVNALIGSAVRNSAGSMIWVEGEITDFAAHGSGHWYFSLKDEKAEIRAVCWKSATHRIGFLPENGMAALCRCSADFYERRGTVNLTVTAIEPRGAGAKKKALARLLEKLEKEGLFAPERKKPVPFLCSKIGVAAAPGGAALADIIKVAQSRFPNVEITVSPCLVQGPSAPDGIARALARFAPASVDAVILARGGGSDEDLSAFNTEIVARAVAACPFPVISAVGHETDITASDLAADVRAATPSEAAEIAAPVKGEIVRRLDGLSSRLGSDLRSAVSFAEMETDTAADALLRAARDRIADAGNLLSTAALRLDGLSPLAIMGRGYSVVTKDGRAVADSAILSAGDEVEIRFSKGAADAQVKRTR